MQKGIFRGKRLDNEEWVSSGSIIRFNKENGEELCFIPKLNDKCVCTHDEADNILSFESGTFYKVDPRSVSRCVGIEDRFEIPIFGGDIVKHYNDSTNPRAFKLGIIVEDTDHCRWKLLRVGGDQYDVSASCVYEVIGNITDYPSIGEMALQKG